MFVISVDCAALAIDGHDGLQLLAQLLALPGIEPLGLGQGLAACQALDVSMHLTAAFLANRLDGRLQRGAWLG